MNVISVIGSYGIAILIELVTESFQDVVHSEWASFTLYT